MEAVLNCIMIYFNILHGCIGISITYKRDCVSSCLGEVSLRYVFIDPYHLLVLPTGKIHMAPTYLSLTSGGYEFYSENLQKLQ